MPLKPGSQARQDTAPLPHKKVPVMLPNFVVWGIGLMDKFWPHGQAPAFKGQKQCPRTFITSDQGNSALEITGNPSEISHLKCLDRPTTFFQEDTGNIALYFDDDENSIDDKDDDNKEIEVSLLVYPSKHLCLLRQVPDKKLLHLLDVTHQWIGQGREFPKLPLSQDLDSLCMSVLTYPEEWIAPLLPAYNISVVNLLKFNLLQITDWPPECGLSYDPDTPNRKLKHHNPIPPHKLVIGLHESFGQELLNGMQSIHDPCTHTTLLPMWVMQFWQVMHKIHRTRSQWAKGKAWLQSKQEGGDAEHYRTVVRQLDILPWNGPIHGQVSAIGRTNKQPNIVIMNTRFSDAIHSIKSITHHDQPRSFLCTLEHNAKTLRNLYTPIHVSDHYITLEINFEKQSFSYRDSLDAHIGIQEITNKLQWCHQNDSASCRLCAINTIKHNVFGHQLSIPDPDPTYERARWFFLTLADQIAQPLLVEVSDKELGPSVGPSTQQGRPEGKEEEQSVIETKVPYHEHLWNSEEGYRVHAKELQAQAAWLEAYIEEKRKEKELERVREEAQQNIEMEDVVMDAAMSRSPEYQPTHYLAAYSMMIDFTTFPASKQNLKLLFTPMCASLLATWVLR
ncbi:uncharacterized protein EDB91DRAFT_1248138 [Suillus paluster]|uniref:uncharacterized protein n=1 Tax=Suillus paluster TaxID=48578 RepID=UPI001B885BEE|nr:uncharacterized protein EDB91DRAFT_1248138 [Suillus paluster]KAG1740744.1 hypothetical protein EDB91DRAFT_1248138 [Suillus paluster]